MLLFFNSMFTRSNVSYYTQALGLILNPVIRFARRLAPLATQHTIIYMHERLVHQQNTSATSHVPYRSF
jgi:hypothetical protein